MTSHDPAADRAHVQDEVEYVVKEAAILLYKILDEDGPDAVEGVAERYAVSLEEADKTTIPR